MNLLFFSSLAHFIFGTMYLSNFGVHLWLWRSLAGAVSTTDAISVTTESMEMASASMTASPNPNDNEERHSTIDQMAKLLGDAQSMTTSTFDQINEVPTTTTPTTISESDDETDESTTIASIIKNTVQDVDHKLMTLSSDANSATNGETSYTTQAPVDTQEETKSSIKSSMTNAHPMKVHDRSRVVSKNDIESIRGRALNLTGNERPQSMPGGVIYVTAPPQSTSFDAPVNGPAMAMGKSAKAHIFSDDLSDVSMDSDGMDLHSSEHMAMIKMLTTKASSMRPATPMTTTTSTPTIHDPLCQSKVSFSLNFSIYLSA